MPIPLSSCLLAWALMLAGAVVPAGAADAPTKPAKARAGKAKAAPALPDEPEPDVADTVTTEFSCELGNRITIFANENDADHIALRWRQRIHRLTRVGTTTGAKRFENAAYGLVWIGIPSKGMLLDSKLNRQLANECKNAEQAGQAASAPAAPRKS